MIGRSSLNQGTRRGLTGLSMDHGTSIQAPDERKSSTTAPTIKCSKARSEFPIAYYGFRVLYYHCHEVCSKLI